MLPVVTGLGYYLGAVLGVAASSMSEGISIFWLPNGILLAALLLSERRDWPLHLAAAVLAEIAADLPTFTLAQALGFAAVNVFECLLAAWLLERIARPFRFDRLRHAALFGVLALGLACGLAALLGASIYAASGSSAESFWKYWVIWWLGDAMGVLLMTPLLLGWLQAGADREVHGRLEWSLLLVSTLLLATWVFAIPSAEETLRRPTLLFPVAIWAAARFGVRGAASTGLLIAAIAVAANVHGFGPLLARTPGGTVLLLQQYLAVLLFSSLALAALLQELRTTHAALDRLNRELEARVDTRTRELTEANERLEALASIDALTGASNRRHFLEQARIEISRAGRQGVPLSLVMLDIDLFKSVNDRFGHEIGDKVLESLAGVIRATLRSGDLFARIGGEEFALLLPGQDLSEAAQMAERLRQRVEHSEAPGCPVGVTVSAGVSGLVGDADEIGDLLRRADQALYQAKHQGRNQVCVAPAAAGT
ncbi:MAG: diguanylate cyclase [Gammaproteobacteria bacterium]